MTNTHTIDPVSNVLCNVNCYDERGTFIGAFTTDKQWPACIFCGEEVKTYDEGADKMNTDKRNEFLADVITTAVEGGIGYWSAVKDYNYEYIDNGDKRNWAEVVIKDIETGKTHVVTMDGIEKALKRFSSGPVNGLYDKYRGWVIVEDVTNGEGDNFDSDMADWIIQVSLFGEVIYG